MTVEVVAMLSGAVGLVIGVGVGMFSLSLCRSAAVGDAQMGEK